MSATFNFSSGELDTGTGLVLAPGVAAAADAAKANWKPLDARNGWTSFGSSELLIWRHSFAATARFHPDRLALIDCLWKDGSIRKQDWSATDDDLLREKKTLVKLLTKEAQTTPAATSLGVDTFPFSWGTISVRADPRSMMVMLSIAYGG